MTTRVLNGTYTAGYVLHWPTDTISITATGYIERYGVTTVPNVVHAFTVLNSGTIQSRVFGGAGIDLGHGGTVVNGDAASGSDAYIYGGQGVSIEKARGRVTNFGTIVGEDPSYNSAAVYLGAGGRITNGSTTDTQATLVGSSGAKVAGAPATVLNYGTIEGQKRSGVILAAGGEVINGSLGDESALIKTAYSSAVDVYGGVVRNFGTIEGGMQPTTRGVGVDLRSASLVNGSAADTGALIEGVTGVEAGMAWGYTIRNFGMIAGQGVGVSLSVWDLVVNGSEADTAATIQSTKYEAILLPAYFPGREATLWNYGTIHALATSSLGAAVAGGLTIVRNGSAEDTSALIEGYQGVVLQKGPVTNFGAILGTSATNSSGVAAAVYFSEGGRVINGSADDTSARIQGADGIVSLSARTTVINFGTVAGDVAQTSWAVLLKAGGIVTNGGADDTVATIEGAYDGVSLQGASATLINFGTISGGFGAAVRLGAASELLRVEAGCAFEGAVLGDGARLALASGSGTISALADGDLTVSGSMAATAFTDFGTLEIGEAARFSLVGAGTIAAGATRTLNDDGVLTVADSLMIAGTLKGTGTLALAAGATVEVDHAAPSSLTVAFRGRRATLALANPSTFGSTIRGLVPTDAIDLLNIQATSAVLGAGDTLIITNGAKAVATLQLFGNYAGKTFTTASDGKGGTSIEVSGGGGTARPPAPLPVVHTFIAAAARIGSSDGARLALTHASPHDERLTLATPRTSAF